MDEEDEEILEDLEEEAGEEEVGLMPTEGKPTRAYLVGFYSGQANLPLCEEYLAELASLADTFGVDVVGKMACPLRKIDAATYLHKGKLEEIKNEMVVLEANLVIFDEEISPAQQRNLEKILKVAVMDRTELILEIFAQRAQTKEAKLQIELAKVRYQFPRLKRLWSHFSRQRATGGYLKGPGEKQLEMDKRMLKRELEKLRSELKEVVRYREVQRQQRVRSGTPTFAIIGYTNVGKSTLLNAMTGAGVLAEDKLFATLDPTTRKFVLPNHQDILLTDTVGFIRKLPHTLIAAFRSTLEAALHDDVLVHLIDISHPLAEQQAETTYELLKELNAEEESVITVLNKVDQCSDPSRIQRLQHRYPNTVVISALNRTGLDDLTALMVEILASRRTIAKFKIPQSEYGLVTELRRFGHVYYEEYEDNDVIVRAELPLIQMHRFERYRIHD